MVLKTQLEQPFAILEKFWEVSGLRVKSEALWIGSKKGSNLIICSDKNLKWPECKVFGSELAVENERKELRREVSKGRGYLK